jgi:hypothetical protein
MLMCLIALFAGFVAVTMFLRRYADEGAAYAATVRGAKFIRESCRPMASFEAADGAFPRDELDDGAAAQAPPGGPLND